MLIPIPIILGLPLHMWLGIILFALVVFQILTAKKVVKLPFRWHRIMGWAMLPVAAVHATLGFGLYFGLFVL